MRETTRLIATTLGIFVAATVQADLTDFQAATYTNGAGQSLLYRLYVPQNYDPGKSYPLVLHLHGDGESGSDNTKPASHVSAQDLLAHAKLPQYESFVLVPQMPTGRVWDNYAAGQPFPLSLQLLAQLKTTYAIDSNRVYLTGLSRGAVGTWGGLANYGSIFAAGVPAAGWSYTSYGWLLKDKPIWAFQGGADTSVLPSYSRSMVAAIQQNGGKPLYTEYYGAGHNDGTWHRVFGEYGLYEWLYNQSLTGPINPPPTRPPGDPQRSFSDDFSGSAIHPKLVDVAGNYTIGADKKLHGTLGQRTYVRTADADLRSRDFTFEVTLTSLPGTNNGNGIAFVGFGSGEPNPGNWNEPLNAITFRILPEDFNPGVGLVVPGQPYINFSGTSGGQHRIQFVKVGDLLTINLDADYNGELFFMDKTYTVNLGTLGGFDDTNSRMFFGTASPYIGFDNVMMYVVPEPTAVALLALGMPLLLRRRRG